jgi:hypothetical protein
VLDFLGGWSERGTYEKRPDGFAPIRPSPFYGSFYANARPNWPETGCSSWTEQAFAVLLVGQQTKTITVLQVTYLG